jgi:hypothetical protein
VLRPPSACSARHSTSSVEMVASEVDVCGREHALLRPVSRPTCVVGRAAPRREARRCLVSPPACRHPDARHLTRLTVYPALPAPLPGMPPMFHAHTLGILPPVQDVGVARLRCARTATHRLSPTRASALSEPSRLLVQIRSRRPPRAGVRALLAPSP